MAKKGKTNQARVVMRVGNPSNAVTITVPAKSERAALARARRFVKHHTKNIEQGFYDETGFHPIRASKDYSEKRATAGARARAGYPKRLEKARRAAMARLIR